MFNISKIIREWLPIWQIYLPKIDQILGVPYKVFFDLIVQHISHNSNPIFTTSGTGNSLCSDEQILLPLLKKSGYLPRELLDGQTLSEYLRTHLSYTTHNHHQTVINAWLNLAVNSNYIKINPIGQFPKGKPEGNKGEHNTEQVIHDLTHNELSYYVQSNHN